MNWNAYFRSVWEHCRAKPRAKEDHPWNEIVFKVNGNVFAFLGHPDRAGVTVKAIPDALDALLDEPFIKRASYVGRFGWITVSIEDQETLDFALGLIDESYDIIAAKPKRRKSGSRKAKRHGRNRSG